MTKKFYVKLEMHDKEHVVFVDATSEMDFWVSEVVIDEDCEISVCV